MIGIGIAWAAILAMPYSILAKSLDARKTGVYMGIFNFTVTIPQIFFGLCGGVILKFCFGSTPRMMLLLAGILMAAAAVSVAFVKEKSSD